MTRRTVLCFGDSNTHGTPPMNSRAENDRFGPDIRWPGIMAQRLGSDWHLIEEGHPGRTTVHDDPIEGAHRNGLRVLPAVIESHKWIDLMVVMLGTNDCKQRFSLTSMDIALGVARLVDVAKASEFVRDVLVICPPKVLERGCLSEIFAGAEARSEGLASRLETECATRNVAFMDAGQIVQSDPLDGVHLSAEAHARLGRAVADKIGERT